MFPFLSAMPYLYGMQRRRTSTPGFAGGSIDIDYEERPGAMSTINPPPFSGFGGYLPGESLDDDPYAAAATKPWSPDSSSDDEPDPFAPDRDSKRRAMGRGLMAAGIGLLEGAGTGDWTGGIARAAAGFSQARDSSLDRDRGLALEAAAERRREAAERRADSAESRATAQEIDRDRLADTQYDAANAELAAFKEQQDRGRRLRSATGKSADQMVQEIDAVAASNPKDETLQRMARRAAGYALGEDSDLNKLADLHDKMTQRAGRDADADWVRGEEIETASAQAKHGYGPIAEGSRAERGLGLEERRVNLYGQQVAHQGERTDRWAPTPDQMADNVRQEANVIFNAWLDGRMKGVGELDREESLRTGQMVTKQPPSTQEIDAARRDATLKAQQQLDAQLGDWRRRNSSSAGTPSTGTPRSFSYDPRTGRLIQD